MYNLKAILSYNCQNVESEVVVETKPQLAVVDDSEYKEGTPVTVETYQAWWAGFYQELKSKKAGATGGQSFFFDHFSIQKGNVQLTGKKHFIGSTAIYVEEEEEDEEDDEGEAIEEVEVKEDVVPEEGV